MTEITKLVSDLPVTGIKSIQISLVEYEQVASNLIAQAERAEILGQDDYAKGGDLIKVARTHHNNAEQKRKDLVGPLNKLVKFINDAFKGPKSEFDKVRAIIEPKMIDWKRAEDERRAEEARKEAARIEEEALEKAALEEGDDQNRVLNEAADAAESLANDSGVGLRRGMYGSTGTVKKYSTTVTNHADFLEFLARMHREGRIEVGSIVEFRKSGLNNLAKQMITEHKTNKAPGAEFVESEDVRVY